MKSVLISIQPKWCELIANGKKTVEVRKSRPKIEVPFKCYIYETKNEADWHTYEIPFIGKDGELKDRIYERKLINRSGKVIGEFVCDKIYEIKPFGLEDPIAFEKQSCMRGNEILRYLGGFYGYGWHISDLKIYDKPKELGEFKTKKKCKDAPYYGICSESCGIAENGECDGREYISRLTRPPQSYCYVEEV